jgi:hypothetical protein
MEIKVRERNLRKWAYENAYTLYFLSGAFVVTWIVVAFCSWYFGFTHN